MITPRRERQASVARWVSKLFGPAQAADVKGRATRMLEEAIEAAQAAGVSEDVVGKLTRRVYDKPAGDLRQEIGQVGLTLLAFSAAAGFDADTLEDEQVVRAWTTDPKLFHDSYAKKVALGVG